LEHALTMWATASSFSLHILHFRLFVEWSIFTLWQLVSSAWSCAAVMSASVSILSPVLSRIHLQAFSIDVISGRLLAVCTVHVTVVGYFETQTQQSFVRLSTLFTGAFFVFSISHSSISSFSLLYPLIAWCFQSASIWWSFSFALMMHSCNPAHRNLTVAVISFNPLQTYFLGRYNLWMSALGWSPLYVFIVFLVILSRSCISFLFWSIIPAV